MSLDFAERDRVAAVGTMIRRLRHRGPDEQAVTSAGDATLGSARLSIVDRALGHQPMQGIYGEGSAWITYNGEVYNCVALREELATAGYRFRTHSDTEVVLAAHLVWGETAPSRLDGMFAYAIWQPREGHLTLVRDRFGIKPLFFRKEANGLRFASEPKALRREKEEPNEWAILEYFVQGAAFASGHTTGEKSFYQEIVSVEPGSSLCWSRGQTATRTYWRPEHEFGELSQPPLQIEEELAELVRQSVNAMRMGEVPVGTALSGGLDSSWATSELSLEGSRVISSCISFRQDHGDPDASNAQLVSNWLNKRRPGSHELHFAYRSAERYLDDLDPMIEAFDEPHWELRQLGMYANYRKLAELGRTVVLTGEGADELFFGYYQRFPGFRQPALSGADDLFTHWIRRAPWVKGLLRPAFEQGRLPADAVEQSIGTAINRYFVPAWRSSENQLRSMQCWYLHTFLRWLLLVNDRCSMAFSLEGRFPFLSADIVSLALKLPPEWNTQEEGVMQEKVLMRRAASRSLPPAIWRDRRKAPLPVPQMEVYHRFIGDRLQREMEEADPNLWNWLDRSFVEELTAGFGRRVKAANTLGDAAGEHMTAYIALDEPLVVRTAQIFGVLTFMRWYHLCL